MDCPLSLLTARTTLSLIVRDFITPTPHQLDDPRYAPIAAVTSHLESIYRCQRQISAGEVALVDMAAVHPDYAGQGVYRALRMALTTLGFARGYSYITGALSSVVTQGLVLNHLQHRNCAELVLADFIYEGKRPFAAIKTPPKIILAEGPTPPPPRCNIASLSQQLIKPQPHANWPGVNLPNAPCFRAGA